MTYEYQLPLQTDGANKIYKTLNLASEVSRCRADGTRYQTTWVLPIARGIGGRYGKLDPATETVGQFFKEAISGHLKGNYYTTSLSLIINDFEILIHKDGNRFFANNEAFTLKNLGMNIARFLYRVTNEMTRKETAKLYYNVISTPAEIEYVLLNRIPYYFYQDGRKQEVRLNIRQIGDDKAAIELMEGEWGPISFKDLKSYLSHYLYGTKRGSWKFLSPEVLYARLTGKKQSESDKQVMRAFMIQNRTQKLVTDRANVLLEQTLEKFSKNLIHWEEGDMKHILVRGKENDWKFHYNMKDTKQMGGTQMVSTSYVTSEFGTRSVCIDNAQSNSSKADQLVTRLLVAMNDKTSKKMVSTMQGIPAAKKRIRDEYWGNPLTEGARKAFEVSMKDGFLYLSHPAILLHNKKRNENDL